MYTPVSAEIFTLECDICAYNVAYFYEDGRPESAIKNDSWHTTDNGGIVCSACYVPRYAGYNIDNWTLQDLLLIAPARDYHTRKVVIDNINIDLVTDELRSKYCD